MHDVSLHPFLSVVIPAYNERGRIASTIQAVQDYLTDFGKSYEIIVVDDGSSDGTLEIVKEVASTQGTVRLINYGRNMGKGYAVRQGVYASRGDYVMFSDADLSAPIEELPKLFEALRQGYDIAIGSRAVKGAQLEIHQPLYRELGGKGLNLLIQALAVPGIKDTQCGFKLFRGEIAREIFAKSFLAGWGFDVEILYLARKQGYSISEVPVRWHHVDGSKIHPFRAGLRVLYDVLRVRMHKYGMGQWG